MKEMTKAEMIQHNKVADNLQALLIIMKIISIVVGIASMLYITIRFQDTELTNLIPAMVTALISTISTAVITEVLDSARSPIIVKIK